MHLQLPPRLGEAVHCGRGGERGAVVRLYVHLKVGRSGETWDQKDKTRTRQLFDRLEALTMRGEVGGLMISQ